MNVRLIVRRLHLYLGLFLLSWVVMFGASSLLLNHTTWLQDADGQQWAVVETRDYTIDVPQAGDLRPTARRIIADLGYDATRGFGVYRQNATRLMVNLPSFRHPIRMAYVLPEHRVVVERRVFAVGAWLRSMHTHDGYYLDSPWQTVYGITVDVVCVTIVFWIFSGLYLWWMLPGSRHWGWVTIVTSLAAFAWMVMRL
jgi:hypothetical protein